MPKGNMWSSVPLPCLFFNCFKLLQIFLCKQGSGPEGGDIHVYLKLSWLGALKALLEVPENWLKAPETLLKAPEAWSKALEVKPKVPEARPKAPEAWSKNLDS